VLLYYPETKINVCHPWFALVSDNGSVFTGSEFQQFMTKNGIQHIQTAPYHLAFNRLVERAVERRLKKTLGWMFETNLSRFLFQYQLTPHTTSGQSPAQLLLSWRPCSHLDLLHPDLTSCVEHKQELQKQRYDQYTTGRQFVPDNTVLCGTLEKVTLGLQEQLWMLLVHVPTTLNFLMTELSDVMLIIYVSATDKIRVPIPPQMTLFQFQLF